MRIKVAILVIISVLGFLYFAFPTEGKTQKPYPLANIAKHPPLENAKYGPLLYGQIASMQTDAPEDENQASSGSITVTAVVLPVRNIIIEKDQMRVYANVAPDKPSLYSIQKDGKKIPLTNVIWKDMRTCLQKHYDPKKTGQLCLFRKSS